MSKAKIKRGLSDQDMVGKWQETATFEHGIEEPPMLKPTQPAKKESFFSTELQEKVAKNLLEIKLSLFQQGILDYDIKVSRDDNKVILTAVPTTRKTGGK
ncbi:hypothetical protein AXX12_16745 [Anaerosporomusa subterranea]|jgi:hypothetical protein|uniref:Uncharacterized protein n=1 Tax=Anaerosporomusa subterranea TaxID=1794912 RepID=A0A154BVF2_ANASB|nr:hypothetical protein [Anaerosporomusa subterranea]KYZ77912.1 hypothetical protein AXX12_16745 [Anaerosporomusa subterranea]MDF2499982.1 hypothetical protein [Anaerosporomusa subterranea]